MKHNHDHGRSHGSEHDSGPKPVPVRFEFTHPTAANVCIAGTFNNWEPETKPMHSSGSGCWFKETALPPGDYEYCLVVDGQWMPDPRVEERVPNPFGGNNSVLRVHGPQPAGDPTDGNK